MRTFTRLLRWAAAALLAGVAAIALILVVANWSDEPLRPEVAALQRFTAPEADAMQRNGYFLMLGLDAPPTESAQAAGLRRFATGVSDYRTFLQTGDLGSSTVDEVPSIRSVGNRALRCGAEQPNCLRHYLAHTDTAASELQRLAPLMARYRALDAFPGYEEIVLPTPLFPSPPYPGVTTAAELVGIEATHLLHSGQTAPALALLADNRQRLQRLLEGSRTVIGALVATAAIHRQQRLVGDILGDHPDVARRYPDMAKAAAGEASLSLSAALAGEMRWSVALHATMAQTLQAALPPAPNLLQKMEAFLRRAWTRWAYLPQQTANLSYERWREIVALAHLPASDWTQATQDFDARAGHTLGWSLGGLLYPRNPAGKIMASFVSPEVYLSYLQRTQDVEAHRRLLLLQLAAIQQGVKPEQMPAWLAHSPPELRDPYTGQPMGWDAEGKALVFEGREPQSQNPERSATYRVRVL